MHLHTRFDEVSHCPQNVVLQKELIIIVWKISSSLYSSGRNEAEYQDTLDNVHYRIY